MKQDLLKVSTRKTSYFLKGVKKKNGEQTLKKALKKCQKKPEDFRLFVYISLQQLILCIKIFASFSLNIMFHISLRSRASMSSVGPWIDFLLLQIIVVSGCLFIHSFW